MSDMSDIDKPLVPGQTVMVLTPSYHWTGRVVGATALHIYLTEVIMYTEIGQAVSATAGDLQGAHGDPMPGIVEIPRPSAQSVAIERLPEHKQYTG
jgi:hypothetical protein